MAADMVEGFLACAVLGDHPGKKLVEGVGIEVGAREARMIVIARFREDFRAAVEHGGGGEFIRIIERAVEGLRERVARAGTAVGQSLGIPREMVPAGVDQTAEAVDERRVGAAGRVLQLPVRPRDGIEAPESRDDRRLPLTEVRHFIDLPVKRRRIARAGRRTDYHAEKHPGPIPVNAWLPRGNEATCRDRAGGAEVRRREQIAWLGDAGIEDEVRAAVSARCRVAELIAEGAGNVHHALRGRA